MKVLVTGGAGFIGSRLAAELRRRGCAVRILDDFSTGKAENLEALGGDVELIRGSILDREAVAGAVRDCAAVFHQAAIPSVARSVDDPVSSTEANVTGTVVLLSAARAAGVRRLVYASSSSVYGEGPEMPKREDLPPDPRSPYAVGKLAGEQYCLVLGRLWQMETVCLRYFNVFGPGQSPASRYAAVVPAFIQAILDGAPVPLEGDGTQSRDFTFVDNVVQANVRALDSPQAPGRVFNVGCGEQHDLNTLIREVAAICGREPEIRRLPSRPGDLPRSLADISRARRLLGYEPSVPFAEGLRRTVAWFRERRASERPASP